MSKVEEKMRFILVGGFLGAGKTTLLLEAAKRLSAQGHKVGLVTNDQAPDLVDTAVLGHRDWRVAEVSGSCFCCNFNGFVGALESLAEGDNKPDVLIAEPVGSCADLSATIVQPLKDKFSDRLEIGPFSVLADAGKLQSFCATGIAGLHPSAAYIFAKQLEEADIIVINKADLLSSSELSELKMQLYERFPMCAVMSISARTGEGMAEWLGMVLDGSNLGGGHLVEMDYNTYAEGEAVLGWLNGTVRFGAEKPIVWNDALKSLAGQLSGHFDNLAAAVGHVKLLMTSNGESVLANLTGTGDTLTIRGPKVSGREAELIINARVQLEPEILDKIVKETVHSLQNGKVNYQPLSWQCLKPGRPQPTHRYQNVVAVE